MVVRLKERIKEILPSFLKIFIRKYLNISIYKKSSEYGFFGNYSTWEDAKKYTSGYESLDILEKCKIALLKVKNGEAEYERDSVLFDKKEYSWPLLSALLWIASKNGNKLRVLDYGGSLGTTYYQNKKYFDHLEEFTWTIVEQKRFVECGKELFEDDHLKFSYNIDESIKNKPSVIILSSVLQYMEQPYNLLKKIFNINIKYIIIDLTGFINDPDRIVIQRVPDNIYKASYPVWFFNEDKFISYFCEKYNLVDSFNGFVGKELYIDNKYKTGYKGFIFKLK